MVRPWQIVKPQQNSLGSLATVGTPEEGEEQRSTWHGVFMELKLQESAHCVLHCGLSVPGTQPALSRSDLAEKG